jgi:hypothetical protein
MATTPGGLTAIGHRARSERDVARLRHIGTRREFHPYDFTSRRVGVNSRPEKDVSTGAIESLGPTTTGATTSTCLSHIALEPLIETMAKGEWSP